MTMPTSVCPLCGYILLGLDPAQIEEHDLLWLREIRAVYQEANTLNSHALSGVGYLHHGQGVDNWVLTAPSDPNLSYTNAAFLVPIVLFRQSRRDWGYGFHDACWKLFLTRLSPVEDPLQVAKILFKLFATTGYPPLGLLDFTHRHTKKLLRNDFDSATYTNPVQRKARPKYDVDPMIWPSLEESNSSKAFKNSENLCSDSFEIGRTESVFTKLPLEIRHGILSHLSLKEIASTRLVCRDFAWVAAESSLPNTIWRNEFRLGCPLDFVFPDFSVPKDWRSLVFQVKAALGDIESGIRNRRIIRLLQEPTARLVEYNLQGHFRLVGPRIYLRWQPDNELVVPCFGAPPHGNENVYYVIQQVSGCVERLSYYGRMFGGCLTQEHRISPFKLHSTAAHVGRRYAYMNVSSYHVDMKQFICGIESHGTTLGYVLPGSQEVLELSMQSGIATIEVAVSMKGLNGLRFQFEDGTASRWVGQHIGKGIVYGFLEVHLLEPCCEVVASFDPLKMVALALACHNKRCHEKYIKRRNPIRSHLWEPEIPDYDGGRLSCFRPRELVDQPGTFRPLINVDFGGPGGVLLSRLARITVYLGDRADIVGIDFFYEKSNRKYFSPIGQGTQNLKAEEYRSYGCVQGSSVVQIANFIAGSQGERIIKVEILCGHGHGLKGLKLTTNFGKCLSFCPIGGPKLAKPLDYTAYTYPYTDDLITGFVMGSAVPYFSVDYFALQYQPQREHQSVARHGPHFAHDLSEVEDETSFVDCLYKLELAMPRVYSTCAPVEGIRRVQIYIGDAKKTRSPRCVSGLLFEYYSGYPPIVLGQLMDAGAEFHIACGERVESFTAWTTRRKSSDEPGLLLGKVVGVQIRTSRGRSKLLRPSIYPESEDRDLYHCAQHRFSSNCVGDLTHISWAFNIYFDRLHAFYSSKSPPFRHQLMPERTHEYDAVQMLLFQDGETQLATIACHMYKYKIVGFRFIYWSGTEEFIGMTGGTTTEEGLTLYPGEQVVRFVALGAPCKNDLEKAKFWVRKEDEIRMVAFQAHDPDTPAMTVSQVSKDEHPVGPSEPSLIFDSATSSTPDARLLGIYGGSDRFWQMGVIIEPN